MIIVLTHKSPPLRTSSVPSDTPSGTLDLAAKDKPLPSSSAVAPFWLYAWHIAVFLCSVLPQCSPPSVWCPCPGSCLGKGFDFFSQSGSVYTLLVHMRTFIIQRFHTCSDVHLSLSDAKCAGPCFDNGFVIISPATPIYILNTFSTYFR